jgi:hypothetical protein
LLAACRVVELGHELTVSGAGRVEVLVAFSELELQVGGVLLEVSDLLVQGVDVGGCAEPGFALGLLADRLGQALFELADAGGQPHRAFVGGEQVCLQGCPGDTGPGCAVTGGREGFEGVDFL